MAHDPSLDKYFDEMGLESVVLDKFHYHEALHTTAVIQMLIQRELLDHPVGEKAPQKIREKLEKAQGLLEAYYQWCGEQGDDLK